MSTAVIFSSGLTIFERIEQAFDSLESATRHILHHAFDLLETRLGYSKKEYREAIAQRGWKKGGIEERTAIKIADAFEAFRPDPLRLRKIEPRTLYRLAEGKKYAPVIEALANLSEEQITQSKVTQLMAQRRFELKQEREAKKQASSEEQNTSGWKRAKNGGRAYHIPPLYDETTGVHIEKIRSEKGCTSQKIVETGTEVLSVILEKNPELDPNDLSKLLDFIEDLLANREQEKIDLVQQTVAISNSDDLAQVTTTLKMSDFGDNSDVPSKELDLSEQEPQQLVTRTQESFTEYRVNQIAAKLVEREIATAPAEKVQDIVRNAFSVKVYAHHLGKMQETLIRIDTSLLENDELRSFLLNTSLERDGFIKKAYYVSQTIKSQFVLNQLEENRLVWPAFPHVDALSPEFVEDCLQYPNFNPVEYLASVYNQATDWSQVKDAINTVIEVQGIQAYTEYCQQVRNLISPEVQNKVEELIPEASRKLKQAMSAGIINSYFESPIDGIYHIVDRSNQELVLPECLLDCVLNL
ncbi:MAG: hypothetical protein KME64_41555 [Scytonematopsis contorta HA4267-MV1]|jgi:hypothetical protein|nr:hypothetical protein [Scytonematopsis contorta HA4267-MV1]